MPARDGRGPQGNGPMSGRGLGYCVSTLYENDCEVRPVVREVRQQGRLSRSSVEGRGQGYRGRYRPMNSLGRGQITQQEELRILKREVQQLVGTIGRIESRIYQIYEEKEKGEK